MRILSVKELQQADAETLIQQDISMLALMERAAQAVVDQLFHDFGALLKQQVVILCGKGNNGGDGLVIAHLLQERAVDVKVFLYASQSYSEANLANQERIAELHHFDLTSRLTFGKGSLLIDCIFGFGLTRELDSAWEALVAQINAFEGAIVSVDMPSGLLSDKASARKSPIVQATTVYTLHCPKLPLLHPDAAAYVGDFKVLDIGLYVPPITEEKEQNLYGTEDQVKLLLKPRGRFSHKGSYGHALIIGGSYGKVGAALMCAQSALRTGCGLLSMYVPRCGYIPIQAAFPEAMLLVDKNEEYIQEFPAVGACKAVGVGIGLGQAGPTVAAFLAFLAAAPADLAMVLDADAINIVAQHQDILSRIPKNTILSPHPKELARLIGSWADDFEKMAKVRAFTEKNKLIVIVKGANTAIVLPSGKVYYNSTGNPGMATAGAGDVLTGMLTSLLAQGYTGADAALLAVYLHGLAGDLASQALGQRSLIATDIIKNIGQAYLMLEEL